MKRIRELRPADFEQVAVWRYQGSSDENAVVRATDRTEVSANEGGVFIARTQFSLANGAQYIGFCSPTEDSALNSLQPVIVTADGPVYFWFEEPPSAEFLRAQWIRLGVDAESVFPVYFRCTVPVGGKLVHGRIDADDLTGAA